MLCVTDFHPEKKAAISMVPTNDVKTQLTHKQLHQRKFTYKQQLH